MFTEKTRFVLFVMSLLSVTILSSPPWYCSAATPKIAFDVPDTIECREVTTAQFAKSNPAVKVIEAKFRISARMTQGEEQQVAWVEYELESLDKRFRMIDFLPNTRLEETTANGYIEIEENTGTAIHAGGTASGDASIRYATAQASINGQYDSNRATVKRYKAITPKVSCAGKWHDESWLRCLLQTEAFD